jgi:hypothetical protein
MTDQPRTGAGARALAGAFLTLAVFLLADAAAPHLVLAASGPAAPGLPLAPRVLLGAATAAFVLSTVGSAVSFAARMRVSPGRALLPLLVNAATIAWLMVAG